MNDTSSPDADRIDTLNLLRAENVRLRAALAEATVNARGVAERYREREAEHGNELSSSRRDAAQARAATRLAHADLFASEGQVTDLEAVRDALLATDERLSLAFEASGSIGWWDWDIPGDRLYASPHFARMYGVDPDTAAKGAPLAAFVSGIHPDDRKRVGERIQNAVETAGEFAEEYRLLQADGSVIWVYARGRCYHDANGKPLRYPGVAIDITARKASDQALAASEARMSTIMDAVPVGILLAEAPSGRIVAGNGRMAAILGHDTLNVSTTAEYSAFVAFHDDNRPVAPEEYPLARICAGETDRATLEVNYQRPDGTRVWIDIVGEAIKDDKGRTVGGVVAVSDISSRKSSEARRTILNHELAHRLKNTLAVVQSVATQTLRTAPDLVTARDTLTKRIQALSKGHDVLLTGEQDAGSVEAIIQSAVSLHDPDGRIALSGPSLYIGPKAALTLVLIMHELATNAVKYGALSVPEGKVDVGWVVEIDKASGMPTLALSWREIDGPPASPPTRKGFGTRLIEMGLSGKIGGSVDLDYALDGLKCRIVAPLTELQASDE